MRKVPIALLALVLLAGTGPAAAQQDDEPTTAAATTTVNVRGHGFGHGRGMGQYGAFGYASDHGWSWQQITDHFYGGTSAATESNRELDVLLKSYKNNETCATEPMGCWSIVFVERGTLLVQGATGLTGPPPGAPHAVAIQWLGGDSWKVYEGTSCNGFTPGGFVERGTFTAGQVHIFLADPNPDERVELISVCEVGRHRYLRGSVVVDAFGHANDSTVRQRTMNRLPIESYLRSVVPAESPSSWGGTNGSAPGQHALNAQAIAARSYALAGDGRYQPADTCDDIFCQVYRGFGTNTGGAVEVFESTNGNIAVAGTAGQIRRTGAGGIARTEFSSSTGGYTAGGTFPAVVDDGDDVAANPNHNWSVTIPVGEVEARLDAFAGRDMGSFEQFVVTERNGLGEDGGRTELVRAELSGGDVTLTGNQFRSIFQGFGVKSDWFVVPPPTSTSTFDDTAGNAHEANIEKIADAGIAAGYPDGGFHPDEPVTRGQMATFLARGYHLPAASSPTFSDIDGDVHEANIRAVANAGIALGYADGTYRPAERLNRGQMAVFLTRAEDLEAVGGTGGCDVEGHLYEGEIRAVLAAGIATGDAQGCFHPDDPVTRGQMATFLVRALGL